MGGAVASLLATSHPELVERCVFIDILGPHSTNPGSSPKQLRANIASKREFYYLERIVRFSRASFACLSLWTATHERMHHPFGVGVVALEAF